jgi:hypothetical protein
MKRSLTFITLLLSAATGFAQGKVSFAPDTTHLVYFSTNLGMAPASLAGRGVYGPTITTAMGTNALAADLWAGTSANSLSKVTSITSWSAVAEGRWTSTSVILPNGMPGAVTAWFQINIHDARFASAQEAWAGMGLCGGISAVFTAAPGISAYSPLYATAAPTSSTWPAGTFPMGTLGFGAIEVFYLPEPSTLGLLGLGAAGLMIARRRR